MQKHFFIFIFFILTKSLFAQREKVVFESGKEGFAVYRIPSIIRLPNGKILAFAEGRVNGGADFGNIKIVMKFSNDHGKTWSILHQMVSNGNFQVGNSAPVVDVLDPLYPNGKIYLFYNTGNESEMTLRQGKGLREVWFISSGDEGATWSNSVNITNQVHHPNGKMENRIYNNMEDWRTYANTPGHATQCLEGKYKGRIFVAANHSIGPAKANFKDYESHGYFTDDHGKTFKISTNLNLAGSNEATAAFIKNDRLVLNARNQSGDIKNRIVAYSNDGGESFDTVYFDQQLIDPICEGAILNIGTKNNNSVLAFVNAADSVYRNNLTLKISFDEGKNWSIQKSVDSTNDLVKSKEDYAAYSDIIKMGRRKVGILYEKEKYSKIVFKTINW